MMNATNTRNRSPFTPTQWQELEHQALIYKYMVSGVPIPPELIYSVKRSLESSLASRLFPHQPRWGCFQVGFGRKADPEPGRCRRTDGKKWRCSKEAFPDSKYCERHMHRGRNRSRKPVELASTTTSTTATTTVINPSPSINRNLSTTSPFASSYSLSPLSSPTEPEFHVYQNPSHSSILNPFLYPHSSSSGPPGSGFSPQNSTTHNLFLDSGSSSHAENDYRYFHGMREGVDERAFFPEASGSARSLQDSYQQLAMSSYKGYSHLQFDSLADTSKQQQEDQQQHCFVLGTDFKSSATRPIKLEKEGETQKPLHHFFGEWPPKSADSWLDLAPSSRLHTADS
ncbi:growth-regulating factor 5 isoform X2 [Hevea brasiliensis]|uniref:growth-regulating factor 5 isoform X2 n=1 Tax=Hevea brasiliensis TaxID=3981 RepID=UPI0025F1E2E0|nr:growth-regulating factor 5 isoform X2 [Hevea brasiliensis]